MLYVFIRNYQRREGKILNSGLSFFHVFVKIKLDLNKVKNTNDNVSIHNWQWH